MVYIPFVSLLGIQAALESFVSKQSAPEPALITAEDFVDPRTGGGSLLDHDSGGLGEPLNVSLFPLYLLVRLKNKCRLSFQGSAIRGSSRTGALCTG
jgi:hypothetical protein